MGMSCVVPEMIGVGITNDCLGKHRRISDWKKDIQLFLKNKNL